MDQIATSSNEGATAVELFGKENATAAIILAENGEAADGLERSITGVSGALKEMTDKRLDTAKGKITLLKSAWEGFILSLDTGNSIFSKAVKGVIQGLTDVLGAAKALNEGGFDGFLLELGKQGDRIKREDAVESLNIAGSRGRGGQTSRYDRLTSILNRLKSELKELNPESEKFKQTQKDIAEVQKKLNKYFTKYTKTSTKKSTTEKKEQAKDLKKELSDLEKEMRSLAEAYIKTGGEDQNLLDKMTSKTADIEELNKKIKETEGLIKRFSADDSTVGNLPSINQEDPIKSKSEGTSFKAFKETKQEIQVEDPDNEKLKKVLEERKDLFFSYAESVGEIMGNLVSGNKEQQNRALKDLGIFLVGMLH